MDYHLKYLAALTNISFSTNNSESNIAICAARPIILLVPDGMLCKALYRTNVIDGLRRIGSSKLVIISTYIEPENIIQILN
jgi:hypothetical protein